MEDSLPLDDSMPLCCEDVIFDFIDVRLSISSMSSDFMRESDDRITSGNELLYFCFVIVIVSGVVDSSHLAVATRRGNSLMKRCDEDVRERANE